MRTLRIASSSGRWQLIALLLVIAALGVPAARPQAPAQTKASSQADPSGPQPTAPPISDRKPDAKKAKRSYQEGLKAEQTLDWDSAYEAYSEAVQWAPDNRDYLMHREVARSRLVQLKVDAAEHSAVLNRMADARKNLLEARYLDPANTVVRDRLAELSAMQPDEKPPAETQFEPSGETQLHYSPGTQNIDYRGNTQGLYDQVARQFGVEVAFDVDMVSRPARLELNDVDFPTAMRLVGDMTGTFWRPLTSRLFFVSPDTPQKRKDYAVSVVRTIVLPASETPDQMTETLRVIREIAGITRTQLDTYSRTLTLRASPQAVAVATGLVDDLEKPVGELILEMEILEIDRNYARQLGITPPQTSTIYTLTPSEITEAEQSLAGLVSVITTVFGQPSSLSGLTSTQITSLLTSGQLGVNSLLPPLVAFGGGETTMLATVPGASANFQEMLSLVQHGRRILLRAEDGQPATFFVGDRIPVELSNYSASLSGTGTSVAGLSASNFPITNYDTGIDPTSLATASLRNNGINDLIATNFTDNTISVLLGDSTTSDVSGSTAESDGTFGAQTTFPTGLGPVSLATGSFQSLSGNSNIDLAVANQTANTISILLGNGDGTFQPKTDLPAGNQPVNVIAANMHDVNGNGSLDLVVANHNDNTIYIYQGNGDGTFKTPTKLQLPAGYGPSSIAAGNFNNDSHLDLAVADEGNATVSIFLGNGEGTFQPRIDYPVGNSPDWVSAYDVNGDGVLDLEVANKGSNTVSILLGNGTTVTSTATGTSTVANGTFAAQTAYPAGTQPTSIAVADFDVNGLPDLAVTDFGDNAVSVLLNLGTGTFGPNYELPVGTNPSSIVAAELDESANTNPDVAVVNSGSNNLSAVLNLSNMSSLSSSASSAYNSGAFPGVQYIDIGLKVKATARIHADNQVTIQLDLESSSLAGQSLNTIPVINNETLSQTVRVKENETAALADILQSNISNALDGTPGLGTVPAAGLLAGDQNNQDADTELLILVTPRLVREAPRVDHTMYAGQGSLDNSAGGPAGTFVPPPPPENLPQPPGQVPSQPVAPRGAQPQQPPQGERQNVPGVEPQQPPQQ